jgi:uncharacterized protein with PhoU and TrkA domain
MAKTKEPTAADLAALVDKTIELAGELREFAHACEKTVPRFDVNGYAASHLTTVISAAAEAIQAVTTIDRLRRQELEIDALRNGIHVTQKRGAGAA